MSTTILSFQNRIVIETLHNEGRSLQYIANYLGFSKTTIFNELHRLNSEYQAELAQTDFERKVSQRGRKSSLTKNLKHLVEEKIQVQKWSPEQVAHVVGIAYKTVYNWIDHGWLDVQLPDLPDHGIRRVSRSLCKLESLSVWFRWINETSRLKYHDKFWSRGESDFQTYHCSPSLAWQRIGLKLLR